MKRYSSLLVAGAVVLAGCYHATINTGLPPGNQTIEKPWAAGFVYGLVPPSTVEAASECANGVARVETKLSFLNQLVAGITLGIFTPMAIQVTCASGGMDDAADGEQVKVDPNSTMEQKQRALTQAARRAAKSGTPVWLKF